MDRYVFAAVSYANAAPLAHFLPRVRPAVGVTYGRPVELAEALLSGRADVALVPVADYFAIPGLQVIDGLGICADGDVWSVLLKCRRPLEEARVVALDPASRTSNALARIILKDHFHLSVETKHCRPDEPADAAVVIGDRALCDPPAESGDYDLAGLWKTMTGLPFVFAVWAYREDHHDPEALSRIAHAARDAGLRAIGALATIHAARLDLPVARCREYLTSVVRYDLGPREAGAMRLFKEMLDTHGWGLPPARSSLPPDKGRGDTAGWDA